jgi:LacI family transcriptional regulator
VDMDLAELGREAGRRMLDMIAGRIWRGVERLPCSLIVRQSSMAKSGST